MMMSHKHSHATLNFCEKEVRMAFGCDCGTLLLLLSHACIVKMKSRTDYERILETAVSQLTRNLRLVNIRRTKFGSPFGLTIYSSFGEVSVFPCVSAPTVSLHSSGPASPLPLYLSSTLSPLISSLTLTVFTPCISFSACSLVLLACISVLPLKTVGNREQYCYPCVVGNLA